MSLDRAGLRSGIALLIGLFCLAANPPAGAKEGFGSAKDAVLLLRAVPPAVRLEGSRVAVKVGGAGESSAFSQRLQLELQKELVARDGRLVVDWVDPQHVVEVKILRNELKDRWESRSRQERRQIGVDPSGKPLFQRSEVAYQQRLVVRDFSAEWQVSQAATGAILDSGTIEGPFEIAIADDQPLPEPATFEAEAIAKVVAGIAGRIAAGREEMAVLLPEGRFEKAMKLAADGDWSRYRETVAALPPSPRPEEEAYRLYALATANEALAYAAADPAARHEFLKLAESQYQQAIAANPGEKQFAKKSEAKAGAAAAPPPVERVKAALAALPKIEAKRSPVGASGGEVMDNAALIRLAREGKGSYAMLTAIKAAPRHAFDLSPAGLAELTEAGIDPKLIARLPELSAKD